MWEEGVETIYKDIKVEIISGDVTNSVGGDYSLNLRLSN